MKKKKLHEKVEPRKKILKGRPLANRVVLNKRGVDEEFTILEDLINFLQMCNPTMIREYKEILPYNLTGGGLLVELSKKEEHTKN